MDSVRIGQRFVDATMLSHHDLLHLFVCQVGVDTFKPVGQLPSNLQRLLVATQSIGVSKPCKQLMQRVIGHPTNVYGDVVRRIGRVVMRNLNVARNNSSVIVQSLCCTRKRQTVPQNTPIP